MQKRYPRQLSYGSNNPCIALTETEVAKVFSGDTRSDIGSEAEKLKFANNINDLLCKFIRLDFDEKNNWDLLVMERIYLLTTEVMRLRKENCGWMFLKMN